MMAAAYGSSPRSFRLLGLVHGHFGDDILPDAVADDGRQKLHINTGIAMVVPAEKIREALAGYASAEEIEENDFRRKTRFVRVGDTSPQPNVTIGKVVSESPYD